MELNRLHAVAAACALAPLLPLPAVAANNVVFNPIWWPEQQFARRDREPDDRGRHFVHHQPADR